MSTPPPSPPKLERRSKGLNNVVNTTTMWTTHASNAHTPAPVRWLNSRSITPKFSGPQYWELEWSHFCGSYKCLRRHRYVSWRHSRVAAFRVVAARTKRFVREGEVLSQAFGAGASAQDPERVPLRGEHRYCCRWRVFWSPSLVI